MNHGRPREHRAFFNSLGRFWRWKDYPLPDSPAAIAPLSTDSRFTSPGSLAPTALPDALVKFQAIPDAPAPTGLQAALGILAEDVFKDLTGLTQNQRNAMAALTASLGSATAFGGEAVSLALARDAAASLDRTLGQIEGAKAAGYLDAGQASAAARDALTRSFGGSNSPATKPVTTTPEIEEAIGQAAGTPGGSATITRQNGEDLETVAFETSADDLAIGGAPRIEWIDHPLWVSVPLLIDRVKAATPPATGKVHDVTPFATIDGARNAGAGRAGLDAGGAFVTFDAFGWPQGLASAKRLDLIQSALDSGLLKADPADPTRFLVKVEARLGYPGRATSSLTPRPVHFPHSGKRPMSLAVIVHGNAAAWIPTGASTAVTLPNGLTAVKGTLSSVPSHEGYRYLQDHMAAQGEPVISLSINTNIANATGSLVEMRARLVNAAIKALKDEIAADPAHVLKDAIDFDKVALVGHSRGGEAVARAHQLNLVSGTYKCRAVCAVAPTDWLGVTTASGVSVDQPDASVLVVWGGLDGDVKGLRVAGREDELGSGLRIYDRCASPKALVFAPACTHNRFNNPVWKDEAEWQKVVGGAPVLNPPAGVATEAGHEALLKECVWAFLDLTLNGNAARQPLFRGEVASSSGLDLIQQWRFGRTILTVDDFEGAAANFGARQLGADMTIREHVPLTPPAGTALGSRLLHCGHRTQAAILDIATSGGSSTLLYDLTDPLGQGADLTVYDLLTIRIGQHHDPTDQTSLDALAPPEFVVRMTEGRASGRKAQIDSLSIYAAMPNPLGRPRFKEVQDGGATRNATQMLFHTFAVEPSHLAGDDGTTSFTIDLTDIASLEIEFLFSGSDEIWIDSIEFIRR